MISRNNAVIFAALMASAEAFAPAMNKAPSTTALDAVSMFYSTSTGNTETVAGYIAEAAGGIGFEDIGDAVDFNSDHAFGGVSINAYHNHDAPNTITTTNEDGKRRRSASRAATPNRIPPNRSGPVRASVIIINNSNQ